MKMKTFKKVVSMAMALSMMFCASGCYETMKIEDDGIFEYTYLMERTGRRICDRGNGF